MQQISWPVSYEHFNFRGKDYVFFGDVHTLDNVCPGDCTIKKSCWNLEIFLTDLCQRKVDNKEYMDLFFELFYGIQHPVLKTLKVDPISYIIKTVRSPKFLKCWSDNKQQCPYNPYARLHYVDVRIMKTMMQNKETLASDPIQFIEKYPNTWKQVIVFNNLYEHGMIYDVIDLYFDSDNFSSDIFRYLTSNIQIDMVVQATYRWKTLKIHPIRKQYIKLLGQEPEIAELIRSFVKQQIQIMLQERDMIRTYQEAKELDADDLEYWSNLVGDAGVIIQARLLDTYLLLRLFRKFDKVSQTAIAYAGEEHIDFYSKFFTEELKCESLTRIRSQAETIKGRSKCLDGKPLAHLFHTPHYVSDSNEYLYGQIMAGKRFTFEKDAKAYYIDGSNVNQVLQVGYDTSRYYLANSEYDRIYFNTPEFLRGYGNVGPIYEGDRIVTYDPIMNTLK